VAEVGGAASVVLASLASGGPGSSGAVTAGRALCARGGSSL